MDSLRLAIAALQDSFLALEAVNAHAYHAGYQAALGRYQDLSDRYVAELRKPRIGLGGSIGMIAAAGAGFIVARAIHE